MKQILIALYLVLLLAVPAVGNMQGLKTSSTLSEVYTNGSTVTVDGSSVSLTGTLEDNILELIAGADHGNSTSTGGALLINNTANVGAGIVIYSNQGASADGRLFAIRSDNAAFDQQAAFIQQDGTGSGLTVDCNTTAGISECTNITSDDVNFTSVGITGTQDDRGTVKITHNKPTGTDAAAAAISLLLNGSGTAAQYLFGDTGSGVTTTGDLIDLRQNGTTVFQVDSTGSLLISGISGSSASARNMRGSVTLSSGTAAVSFSTNEPDASYFVTATCDAAEAVSITSKAVGGFTITSSNGSSTASCDWMLMQ